MSRRVILGIHKKRADRRRETEKRAADAFGLANALERAAEPGPGVITASEIHLHERHDGATLVVEAGSKTVLGLEMNLAALRFLAEAAAAIVQRQSKPRVVATVKHR